MKGKRILLCLLTCLVFQTSYQQSRDIWTTEQAKGWDVKHPWLVGCNFIPSTAINQLEMWQEKTFDTGTIAKELRLAAYIGMNSVRVYLHDLAWQQDPKGFLQRMEIFLRIARRYHIKTIFVFFDSCWDPFPFAGSQPLPVPYRHNSHWVQSPGYMALRDSSQYLRLAKYVKAVVKKFSGDERVLAWDAWNEPDYTNEDIYEKIDLPNKVKYVLPLLKKTFEWIRSQNPIQPITSPIWKIYKDWSPDHILTEIEKIQIEESDIISFHYYRNGEELEKRILWLKKFGKPILCTEYLARSYGSTFEDCLPVLKKHNVAAINWGLVAGKTNTIYPWDSWQKEYNNEPTPWHHDIFRKDGTPYRKEEIDFFKTIILRIINK